MKEYRVITMHSKELKRDKRIFVYLPKSYEGSDKFYPVMYMHDGQNLFDDTIAFMNRSWRILDIYQEQAEIPEVIIVGIESDSKERAKELIPFEFTNHLKELDGGEADLYLQFITKTVKPYIDRRFRTFKSPKNTAIMGSSFGGVNSIYASLAYSEYFTRFACLSNALMYEGFYSKLKQLALRSSMKSVKKFYMDVGTKETQDPKYNEAYVETNIEYYEIMKSKIDDSRLRFEIVEDAIHHESAWEVRFPDIIKFLFND